MPSRCSGGTPSLRRGWGTPTGTSTYYDEPGGRVTQVFDNCFVMRFDDAGRCRDFTEYYTKRP